jgi:hypothetical protein
LVVSADRCSGPLKHFLRGPVIATLALDSAPVCHDPDDGARAGDLNKL